MIPHRQLSNELLGHGLKQRVTACRKRLRVRRHRVLSHEGSLAISEITSEIEASFPAEYPGVRESLSEGEQASEFQRREVWLRPGQEVGIT